MHLQKKATDGVTVINELGLIQRGIALLTGNLSMFELSGLQVSGISTSL